MPQHISSYMIISHHVLPHVSSLHITWWPHLYWHPIAMMARSTSLNLLLRWRAKPSINWLNMVATSASESSSCLSLLEPYLNSMQDDQELTKTLSIENESTRVDDQVLSNISIETTISCDKLYDGSRDAWNWKPYTICVG